MKSKLPLLAFMMLAVIANAFSQIVIERSDMPQIGYQVITGYDENTVFQIGEAGANQTWNFGNAMADSYDTSVYLSPLQVPNHELFPEADIVGYASLNDSYSSIFLNDVGNDMAILGMDANIILWAGVYTAFHSFFNPPQWLQLPYHYEDNHTATFTETSYGGAYADGMLNDSSMSVSHINMTLVIDAWGTITTPAGTFQVLRSKTTESSVDSLFSWVDNSWQFMSVNQFSYISYDWIAKDYGYVASLTTDGSTATGLTFMISQTMVNNSNIQVPENQLTVFPNPATDHITISATVQPDKVNIYNINGQLQITSTNQKVIDVSDLSQGVYIVKAIKGNQVSTTRFIRK